MKIIILTIILIAGIALLSEVNKFPNINEPMAELICIQEGIEYVSVD